MEHPRVIGFVVSFPNIEVGIKLNHKGQIQNAHSVIESLRYLKKQAQIENKNWGRPKNEQQNYSS